MLNKYKHTFWLTHVKSLLPVFRAALLASQVLPNTAKGDTYKQFEWVLLESHATLLEVLMKNGGHEKLITQRCQRLSSLIQHSTLPMNEQLLSLQEKVGL